MKQLVINWKDQLLLYLKKPWSMRGPSVKWVRKYSIQDAFYMR